MFCIKCGNKLPDDARVCNGCGAMINITNPPGIQPSAPTVRAPFDAGNQAQQDRSSLSNPVPGPPYPAYPAQWGDNSPLPKTQLATGPGAGQVYTGPYPPSSSVPPGMYPAQATGSTPSGPYPTSSPYVPPGTYPPQASSAYSGSPSFSPVSPGMDAPPAFTGPYPPTSSIQPGTVYAQPYTGPYMQPPSMPSNTSAPYTQVAPGYVPNPPAPVYTQYAGPYMPGQAPAPPPPRALPPANPNWVQRLLIRTFGLQLASNPLLGVGLGSIVALVLGVLAASLVLNITQSFMPAQVGFHDSVHYTAQELYFGYTFGMLLLHSSFRDTLQLFVVMHGAGLHIQGDNGSISRNGSINGFLCIPALLLMLAGYIAASTDFRNNARSGLWRGVAVALPYTALLYIAATQVTGCIPDFSNVSYTQICAGAQPSLYSSSFGGGSLSVDMPSLLLFGLLWGGLFGLLGASIKLGQGRWRSMLFTYLRRTPQPQIPGVLLGGLVTSGISIGLALILSFSLVGYISFSVMPALTKATDLDWRSLVVWCIAQGPLNAINGLFYALGAPFTLSATGLPYSIPGTFGHNALTLSLFGSNTLPAAQQPSPWLRLLVLAPAIGLFVGGRVSANMSRAQTAGSGAVQGALIAIPFSLIMALLTTIATVSYTLTSTNSSGSGPLSATLSAGSSAFDLFLWTLLWGVMFGALGGMYQASHARVATSSFLFSLLTPLRVLSNPFFLLMDHFTKQPHQAQRSAARSMLYAALLVSLVLAVVALVAGMMLMASYQTISLTTIDNVRNIITAVVIFLPGLFLLWTAGVALARDPVPQPPLQPASQPRPYPSMPGFQP